MFVKQKLTVEELRAIFDANAESASEAAIAQWEMLKVVFRALALMLPPGNYKWKSPIEGAINGEHSAPSSASMQQTGLGNWAGHSIYAPGLEATGGNAWKVAMIQADL